MLIAGGGLALLGLAAHAQVQTQARETSAPALTPALSLPQALQAARDNLQVRLARQNAAAARGDIAAADHASAPVLTAKASSIDLQNGLGGGNVVRDKRIDKSVGLDWTLERGNKRELRTTQARRAAEAAELDLDETTVQQQVVTAGAFWDLVAAQQRLAQVQALERHAGELSQAAQRRLRAGDVSQQEALRTEIEARRASAELRAVEADRQKAAVTLAELTGLPAATLAAEADWPQPAPNTMPAADLDRRPAVRAEIQRVAAAESALQGAMALRRNDVTVGASYDHFPGTSRRLFELRLQMPLAGVFGNYGYEGEIMRAQAQLNQAQVQLDKARRDADSDNARLRADLAAAAARSAEFTTTIVPRARQVAEMAELAYSRGALPLVDLIESRRTLRAVLLDEIDVRAAYARALAAWELRQAPPAP